VAEAVRFSRFDALEAMTPARRPANAQRMKDNEAATFGYPRERSF